ncbi:MAG TPA: MarR family transcriptional regulator [Candidatus Coproplasma stercoripullorum]|uniref:MarR family transcriptional regulator n=1 Tax=Candidatus Coproplasma stercoripullorum TaxID=2840751 RepID=A0A9D1AEQ4_9FIRM|nr:MarR family transcriptional regulator [Candidatus Coproplasma stercoripullorum]
MAKFMKNINLVSRSAEVFREERLKDCGIRGCQSKYVLVIAQNPGVSQEDISRMLFVNKSNVARQIGFLETAGFVKKVGNDKDRRAVHLYPTEKLLGALPRVKEVLAEWRALVTEGFTEEEKAELARLSEKMVENARKFMEGQG